ncbi:MAG: hypothetical protein SO000_04435 [Sodaliphilus sp.]|nr:hypothetical protein [Sodaliphilus sp.]
MRIARLCIAVAAAALLTPQAATLSAQAQQRSGWATRMLNYKHQLIIDKLGMTKAQEQRFMPLYEAMEREIYKANSDARALAKKVEATARPTDEQYAQAAEALSKARLIEGQIEARYFDKFEQILSKKQLFLLKQAEISFTRNMLSRGKNAVKKSR